MHENLARSSPSHLAHVVAGTTVVELCGEIDLLAAPALTARLDALTAGIRPDLVLDLRAVSFIDCTGLGVLCRTRNRVLTRQGRLRLVSQNPCFLSILRITGLTDAFEVDPDLPTTLAANMITVPEC
ncbi:anti-sigma factor antagonist [Streptomyces sp. WAC 01325]|uniref:STAS domain-containing protein n=1 Tax=Streptomyces sp. WAC 01325 TaxID=2203202 RepID=UPI000F876B60|nr:STAS domain-containing protein [Streptomyces sp. WAC 01325]RSN18295.1 anti-sigma factor antagonist [Streptomyces sp. WAC 01325]